MLVFPAGAVVLMELVVAHCCANVVYGSMLYWLLLRIMSTAAAAARCVMINDSYDDNCVNANEH